MHITPIRLGIETSNACDYDVKIHAGENRIQKYSAISSSRQYHHPEHGLFFGIGSHCFHGCCGLVSSLIGSRLRCG
jgi:hypothetical protein